MLIPFRHRQVDAALSSVICVICPVTGVAAALDTTILFKTVCRLYKLCRLLCTKCSLKHSI